MLWTIQSDLVRQPGLEPGRPLNTGCSLWTPLRSGRQPRHALDTSPRPGPLCTFADSPVRFAVASPVPENGGALMCRPIIARVALLMVLVGLSACVDDPMGPSPSIVGSW